MRLDVVDLLRFTSNVKLWNGNSEMSKQLRIYVASSWRNTQQGELVTLLKAGGFEVYDFKNPKPGNHGFAWKDCEFPYDGGLIGTRQFPHLLHTPRAQDGFETDKFALDWCNVLFLLLPCGKSAHLEAGYAAGQGKHVIFVLGEEPIEPELMYLLGSGFCRTMKDAVTAAINLAHVGYDMRDSVIL